MVLCHVAFSTVGLYKSKQQDEVRPLGLRNTLIRVFHREVIHQSREEVRDYLEPQQMGQSQACAAKFVHSVRGLITSRPDFIAIQMDLKNAYNEISRLAVLETMQCPELSHLASFFALILASDPALESGAGYGAVQGQGCPSSGTGCPVGMQPSLVRLDEECRVGGGMARGGADDFVAVGPADIVIPAVQCFEEDLQDRCNLSLQWTKSKVFIQKGNLPPNTPVGLQLAGEDVDGVFRRGLDVYGIPLGEAEFVTHKLKLKAEVITRDGERAVDVLAGDRQAL